MAKVKNKCKRCGQCCTGIWLFSSPEDLKKSYLNWIKQKGSWYNEIYLLYPMFVYKGKGKYPKTNKVKYHYRCKHYDKKRGCTIQKIKPEMCKGFPFYGIKEVENLAGIGAGGKGRISQYKGCGYNE